MTGQHQGQAYRRRRAEPDADDHGSLVDALDAIDSVDLDDGPPPPVQDRAARPPIPLPRLSETGIYVAISVIFALIFGTYTGLFARAFGDPSEIGVWTAIGSTLFVFWVIGVTTYAVLRISFLVSRFLLQWAIRLSAAAYVTLKTPLMVLAGLGVVALALVGAYALWLRMAAEAAGTG